MNRRGFFSTLFKAAVAFTILPPAETYQRIWKAVAPAPDPMFNCDQYISYLYDNVPRFDEEILESWFPTYDPWIGKITNGDWTNLGTGLVVPKSFIAENHENALVSQI